MKKKAISPVIATVLLIAITIILGLIVFLWFQGITEEAITKFDGTNVKLICNDVDFETSYGSGNIFLSNIGNVPIYKFKAKISGGGNYRTELIGGGDINWPKIGLNQGEAYKGLLETKGTDKKILVIPVLIGLTDSGAEKAYTCEETYSKTIEL